MSLDQNTIKELQIKLLEEKKQLEDALGRFGVQTDTPGEYETTMENIGTDTDENITEVETYVDNLAVESDLEQKLRDVLDALDRIEQGTYGICEKTGKEIDIERLRIYPAARTAIK